MAFVSGNMWKENYELTNCYSQLYVRLVHTFIYLLLPNNVLNICTIKRHQYCYGIYKFIHFPNLMLRGVWPKFPRRRDVSYLLLSQFDSQFESVEMHPFAVLKRRPCGVVIQQYFQLV